MFFKESMGRAYIISKYNILYRALSSVRTALLVGDISNINNAYEDISIDSENSSVSIADRSVVVLRHRPSVSVSRVFNISTGENYTVESQNFDKDTGLNEDGEIVISGKNLPTSADILSVDYTWRCFFDKHIHYNGIDSNSLFKFVSKRLIAL